METKETPMSLAHVFKVIESVGPMSRKMANWVAGVCALYDMVTLFTIKEQDDKIVATLVLDKDSQKASALRGLRARIDEKGFDNTITPLMMDLVEIAMTEAVLSKPDEAGIEQISDEVSRLRGLVN